MNVIMPIVMTKWRHPSSTGQFVIKYQANIDETSCPTGHHTDRRVNRALEESGRISRKSAPSTGKFPPTPVPKQANRIQTDTQLEAYAAQMPKMLVISRVALKAIRLPTMSDPRPQVKLPIHSPTKRELVVYLTCFSETPNSADREGRVNETPFKYVR